MLSDALSCLKTQFYKARIPLEARKVDGQSIASQNMSWSGRLPLSGCTKLWTCCPIGKSNYSCLMACVCYWQFEIGTALEDMVSRDPMYSEE